MKQKKWITGAASVILVLMMLTGFMAIAAELGSQTDPLVSFSYITDELQPAIDQMVDDAIDSKMEEFDQELADKAEQFSSEIDQKIESLGTSLSGSTSDQAFIDAVAEAVMAKMDDDGSSSDGSASSYEKLVLTSGQQVIGEYGTEILLRLGSAACVAPEEPGLIDLTTGGSLSSGSTLSANHLYMITINGHGFKASGSTTVFIRGQYTVS